MKSQVIPFGRAENLSAGAQGEAKAVRIEFLPQFLCQILESHSSISWDCLHLQTGWWLNGTRGAWGQSLASEVQSTLLKGQALRVKLQQDPKDAQGISLAVDMLSKWRQPLSKQKRQTPRDCYWMFDVFLACVNLNVTHICIQTSEINIHGAPSETYPFACQLTSWIFLQLFLCSCLLFISMCTYPSILHPYVGLLFVKRQFTV